MKWNDEFADGEIPEDTVVFWTKVLFYENAAGVKPFQDLATLVLNAHVIPVSNAFVERTFSFVTNIKTKIRNRLSTKTLEAIIRIRCHLQSKNICCNKFIVTSKMISLFTARNLYPPADASAEASRASMPSASTSTSSPPPAASAAGGGSAASPPGSDSEDDADDVEELLALNF